MHIAVLLAGVLAFISSALAQAGTSDSLGMPLVAAITDGNVAKTRALLGEWKATGKPWPTGPDEKPLLFLAIEGREKEHAEIIEVLLAKGARVDTRGPLGMTALHWAGANGYTERTEQILQHRPAVEATDDRGRTALLVAHSDAAEKLLAAGANVRATDKDGMIGLHYAAQRRTALECSVQCGVHRRRRAKQSRRDPAARCGRGGDGERSALVTRSWGKARCEVGVGLRLSPARLCTWLRKRGADEARQYAAAARFRAARENKVVVRS
ncbi:MAG: ankyrin repeat domain-containing protein [Verrucomicrobiota bacterium]|nr:ankyrin repeat domain-containing protein [Verrucomicrobiota bacterium]